MIQERANQVTRIGDSLGVIVAILYYYSDSLDTPVLTTLKQTYCLYRAILFVNDMHSIKKF